MLRHSLPVGRLGSLGLLEARSLIDTSGPVHANALPHHSLDASLCLGLGGQFFITPYYAKPLHLDKRAPT